MCKEKKFECIDGIFEVDRSRPDALQEWVKRFPCVTHCPDLEKLCAVLEILGLMENRDGE